MESIKSQTAKQSEMAVSEQQALQEMREGSTYWRARVVRATATGDGSATIFALMSGAKSLNAAPGGGGGRAARGRPCIAYAYEHVRAVESKLY